MRTISERDTPGFTSRDGVAAIGIGLAIFMAAMIWSDVPVVTAMALIALGATDTMIVRFRGSPGMFALMSLHLAVYGGLYAIFVGATLDGSGAHDALAVIDVAVSIVPIVLALVRTARALRGEFAAD